MRLAVCWALVIDQSGHSSHLSTDNGCQYKAEKMFSGMLS
jgi:hypothetical protein